MGIANVPFLLKALCHGQPGHVTVAALHGYAQFDSLQATAVAQSPQSNRIVIFPLDSGQALEKILS